MKKLALISIVLMMVPIASTAPDFSVTVRDYQDMEDSTRYKGFLVQNPDEVDWISRYESNNRIPEKMVRIGLENFSESQQGTLDVNLSDEEGTLIESYSRKIRVTSEIASNPDAYLPPQRFTIDLNSTGQYEISARYKENDTSVEYSFQINSFYRGIGEVRSIDISADKNRLLENETLKIESDIVAEKANGETFNPEEVAGQTEIYIDEELVSESNSVGSGTIHYRDVQQSEWASEGEWRIKQTVDGNTAETTFRVGQDNGREEGSGGIIAMILDFIAGILGSLGL